METIVYVMLIATSVVGLTFIVERGLALRWKKVVPPTIEAAVESCQSREDVPMLKRVCEQNTSPLSRLLLLAITRLNWPKEENVDSLQTRARHEIVKLERGLVVLEIIIGIAPLLGLVGTILGVYIGLVALVQADMKKLIAYSSISHMGFVTLGIFIFSSQGVEGAILQMISHGFISGAMFLCVGVMYDRMHSRLIADYGGVANKMPVFAALFMFFAMANSGLPGTSGFVGEWLVILATMKVNFWYAALAATTLIFGAAYTLWMYKRVVFGAVANPHVEALADLSGREMLVLGVLAIAVLAMGLWPAPLGEVLHESVGEILRLAAPGRKLLIGL